MSKALELPYRGPYEISRIVLANTSEAETIRIEAETFRTMYYWGVSYVWNAGDGRSSTISLEEALRAKSVIQRGHVAVA
jgi:hypothetical protein